MFLPYQVDVPMERLPVANWVLIAVTVLVSVAVFLGAGREPSREEMDQFLQARDGGPASSDEDVREYIRLARQLDPGPPPLALVPERLAFSQLFSHLFVHAGFLHLAGNMIFLFVFGNAVNAKLGHVPFLALYLLLGAVAGLGWVALGDGRPAVGASGAIMGLLGIFLILFPRNDVTVLYSWIGNPAGSFEISAVWLILLYLAGDLFGTVIGRNASTAYAAHLVGGVTGMAVAVGLVAAHVIVPERGEENLLQTLGYHPRWSREDDDRPERPAPARSKTKRPPKRGSSPA